MTLCKYKLGDLIEQTNNFNDNLLYGIDDVKGVTISKEIITTKADITGTDLSKFLIVGPKEFVYNPRTHGKKIGLGFNDTNKSFIVTWNNIAFKVKQSAINKIIPEFLFLRLKRNEWDRKACFDSWGSSTVVFSWVDFCSMEIDLPNIRTQERYTKIYLSMIENQKSYERGLNDLKIVCDGYIENLKKEINSESIGSYIELIKEKNIEDKIKAVYGVSNTLKFIEPNSSVDRENLTNYKIVNYQDLAYVPTTHMKIWAVAISDKKEPFVVSPIYEVFRVIDKTKLLPEYLFIWLCRKETIRYAYYNSWGSARENFVFDDLKTIKMPIPSIEVQRSIVEIYQAYKMRMEINEKLKKQIQNICPILIKGSIEEAR